MYEEFYHLKGKPFQLNPDPKFFYRSKGHQRAMAYLRYGLQQGQGFIVVTGDVGTGKTMLVNNLFKEIEGKSVTAAKIVSTNVKDHDLLRLVASSFDLPFERLSKASILKELEQFFRSCIDNGSRVLLVIDEVQNLPRGSLEELRMLSNFDYNGEPLAQSFLLGQREFRATMRSPGLEQLRQRVIAAYHLRPLSEIETQDYITHRLKTVGWKDDPEINGDVFPGIYSYTRGVPRRVNTLMDRLLLTGFLDEQHAISPVVLENVVTEIELERGDQEEDDAITEEQQGLLQGQFADGPEQTTSPVNRESVDVSKLENRLTAMQNAVDSISRRLEQRIDDTAPTYQHDPRGRRSLLDRQSTWMVILSVGVAILAICGVAAFMLLRATS